MSYSQLSVQIKLCDVLSLDETPQALDSCVFNFFTWGFQLKLLSRIRRTPRYFRLSFGRNYVIIDSNFELGGIMWGSQRGVHVPLRVHLSIWRGIFIVQQQNIALRHKNGVYLCSSKNLNVSLKFWRIFVILLSPFVIRNFESTCYSVEMLKGHTVREMLGTPVLESLLTWSPSYYK